MAGELDGKVCFIAVHSHFNILAALRTSHLVLLQPLTVLALRSGSWASDTSLDASIESLVL